jgi:O-antigen/teichoic acid export membrane protein
MTGLSASASRIWRVVAGSELRRNVLETYGTRLLVLAVTFATAVVVARVLGPTGRGLFAVAATVGAVGAQFGNFGLHASNIYYVAKDRALLPVLIGNMLAVVVAASLLSALGGIGLFYWPELSPVHGTLLLLALISVPASLAYLLTQGLLLGVNEVRSYNNIEFVSKFAALALICLLALAHKSNVESYFVVTLLAILLAFLWAFVTTKYDST